MYEKSYFHFRHSFLRTVFTATTTSAQMKYENGEFTFSKTAKFASLHASRVYVSMGKDNYSGATIANAIDKIMGLDPREPFVFNPMGLSLGTTTYWPMITPQSVESALPQAVRKDEGGNRDVDYNAIVVYMVKAMQEQQTKIVELEQRIATLENR